MKNTPSSLPAGTDILSRVGKLVTALADGGEQTVPEIAQSMGIPVSSVYRFIRSLAGIGWVEQGQGRGTYRLGTYFMHIGSLLEDQLDIRKIAAPFLSSLQKQTNMACSLWVRRGTRAVCIERGNHASLPFLGGASRIGDHLPLYRGAASRILLNCLPEGERNAVLAEDEARRLQKNDGLPRSTIEFYLRQDSALGYAYVEDALVPGIHELALPLANHRKEPVAALLVSGLAPSFTRKFESILAFTRCSAGEISRAMGLPDEGAKV